MDKLPSEIIDKILFKKPMLSKIDKGENSFNYKLNLYFNMRNIEIINNQFKQLINEYKYQKEENIYSYWYATHIPFYIYIKYKVISNKKVKE